MTHDPQIERIIREAEQESGGRALAFLIFMAALGVLGAALYAAAGGQVSLIPVFAALFVIVGCFAIPAWRAR